MSDPSRTPPAAQGLLRVPRSQPPSPDIPASAEKDEDEDLDSDIEKEILQHPSEECVKNITSEETEAGEAKLRDCMARLGDLRRRVRGVVVGESECGKTSLLHRFSGGAFSDGSLRPTTFEQFIGPYKFKPRDMELQMLDTAGVHRTFDTPSRTSVDDLSKMRHEAYTYVHVVVLCFDISDPDSRRYIEEDVISEVLHFCQGIPLLLVGCKADLRNDAYFTQMLRKNGQRPITKAEGEDMRKRIGAMKYVECSAKTGEGVQNVFEEAVQASMTARSRSRCRGGPIPPLLLPVLFVLALPSMSASIIRSWLAKLRTA